MLGLQAQNVEQQRSLWSTQLALQRTEILYRELDFYNQALSTISTASALLAGFAFSGLSLSLQDQPATLLRATLAVSCVITTSINLVALCAATFAAIFSMRLALRGSQGENNVEQAVRAARLEYKLVVRIFVAGVVCFHFALGAAGFLQLGPVPAYVALLASCVGLGVVLILFSRIDSRFRLRAAVTSLGALSLAHTPPSRAPSFPAPMTPAHATHEPFLGRDYSRDLCSASSRASSTPLGPGSVDLESASAHVFDQDQLLRARFAKIADEDAAPVAHDGDADPLVAFGQPGSGSGVARSTRRDTGRPTVRGSVTGGDEKGGSVLS